MFVFKAAVVGAGVMGGEIAQVIAAADIPVLLKDVDQEYVDAGLRKAREVTEAIRKGMEVAKRNMITVPMVGTTIPHEVRLKLGSARIMLKPAAPGTGVISGGAMRAVIESAGIKDILTKSHGTNNPINTVRATLAALQQLRTAQQIADLRSKDVEQMVGRRLANAYRRSDGTEPAAAAAAAAEVK